VMDGTKKFYKSSLGVTEERLVTLTYQEASKSA